VFHHVGPHGVELHVAAAGEQVSFALYQAGFVAAFPERVPLRL
jgi:hypothetical protein